MSKTPDQGWATSADWEKHRGLITHLYQDRNMTLNKVVKYMEDKHNFKATSRMYKTRFQQWKLGKNVKAADVIAIHQGTHDDEVKSGNGSTVFIVDGRMVPGERVERYRRRYCDVMARRRRILRIETPADSAAPGPEQYQEQQQLRERDRERDQHRQRDQPARAPALAFSLPPGLRPSAELEGVEHIGRLTRAYIDGSFESGIWSMDRHDFITSKRRPGTPRARYRECAYAFYDGLDLLSQQPAAPASAFDKFNAFFDMLKDDGMLAEEHPSLFVHLFRILALCVARRRGELYASVLNYLRRLAAVVLGPRHPFAQIAAKLLALGPASYRAVAVLAMNLLLAAMRADAPPPLGTRAFISMYHLVSLCLHGLQLGTEQRALYCKVGTMPHVRDFAVELRGLYMERLPSPAPSPGTGGTSSDRANEGEPESESRSESTGNGSGNLPTTTTTTTTATTATTNTFDEVEPWVEELYPSGQYCNMSTFDMCHAFQIFILAQLQWGVSAPATRWASERYASAFRDESAMSELDKRTEAFEP